MTAVSKNTSWYMRYNIVDAALFFVLLVLVLFIGLACFYVNYPEGDVMEHIYCTSLVSSGYVPYRDFFEHHHPLLWYIAVPLARILDRNIEIIGWADYVTFCFFLCGLYFVYRTVYEFLSTRTAAFLVLFYILLPDVFLYYVYFKPDNWMLACISAGIYFYFRYLRDYRCLDLCFSYLLFFVAFMFLQKALIYFPVIAMAAFWGIYKKEIKIKDFLWALSVPSVIMFMCLLCFYSVGFLREYFLLNFVYNQEMISLFNENRISEPFDMGKIVIWAAVFISIGLYKFENKYFRFLCWIFWCLALHKKFYFSPFRYYWYEAYYFAAPIAVAGIMYLAQKKKILLNIIIAETIIYVGFMVYYICHDVFFKKEMVNVSIWEFTINNTNRCDKMINFGGGGLYLFTHIPLYYWFLHGHVDVFGEKMGLHEIEDLNQKILEYKPKFVWADTVYERYATDLKHPKIIHQPDIKMLRKYYKPTEMATDDGGFDFEKKETIKLDYKHGLWLLKSKYRRYNCVYDEDSGRWNYDKK